MGSEELVEFSSELVRDVWPEPEPVALLAGELRDISLDLCRRAKLIDSLRKPVTTKARGGKERR